MGRIWEFSSIILVSRDPDREAVYFRECSDSVYIFLCLPFNSLSQLNYLAAEVEMPLLPSLQNDGGPGSS